MNDLAAALVELLEAENEALAGMRVQPVVAALGEKRRLIEAFGQLAREKRTNAPPPELVERLAREALRNARLLKAAMHAQREVMKVLAQTVRTSTKTSYAARGEAVGTGNVTGIALATSA